MEKHCVRCRRAVATVILTSREMWLVRETGVEREVRQNKYREGTWRREGAGKER